MLGILFGLAICFGLTYLLSVSEATAALRAGDNQWAAFFRNPIFVGMGVGGFLSLLFCGNFAIMLFDIGIGALVGLGVKAVRDKKAVE